MLRLYSVLNLATHLSFESGEEGAGGDNPLQYYDFGLQYPFSLLSMLHTVKLKLTARAFICFNH